jgi:hypothetical protein
MAIVLHGSALTTPRVRAELQASKEKTSALAERYGPSRTTVTKWRARTFTADARWGHARNAFPGLCRLSGIAYGKLNRAPTDC